MKHNNIRHFLFLIVTCALYLLLYQIDIRLNGFERGLLLSDDRYYFELANTITNSDRPTKNYIYYWWNSFWINTFGVSDVLLIIIINSLIFCVALVFYLSARRIELQRYYLFMIMIIPTFFIMSLNYKDGIFTAALLGIFASSVMLRRSNRLIIRIVALLVFMGLILALEGLRLGAGYLAVLAIILERLLRNIFVKHPYAVILSVLAVTVITLTILGELILENMGRSLESYWKKNIGYIQPISGVTSFDVMVIGLIKTIFQFNPISAFKFLSNTGEHGYNGYILKLSYSVFVITYPIMLYLFIKRISKPSVDLALVLFTTFYLSVYSLIYGGLIGLRLSIVLTLCMCITVCFKKRKEND